MPRPNHSWRLELPLRAWLYRKAAYNEGKDNGALEVVSCRVYTDLLLILVLTVYGMISATGNWPLPSMTS